ncbi:hypothetical protein [uncultured Croceitalea sp.]|uniref:hypothetical protein n=1 Tax=uncultured Croceitalea sp. TaxID=1798908 RepID=UPI003305EE40
MRTLAKKVVTVVIMGLTLVSCDSKSFTEQEALYKIGTEGETEEVKKKPNAQSTEGETEEVKKKPNE